MQAFVILQQLLRMDIFILGARESMEDWVLNLLHVYYFVIYWLWVMSLVIIFPELSRIHWLNTYTSVDEVSCLTHCKPLVRFYNPLKTIIEDWKFPDVFRSFRKGPVVWVKTTDVGEEDNFDVNSYWFTKYISCLLVSPIFRWSGLIYTD